MNEPKASKNRLDEFFAVLEELKKLWAWIVIAAGLPFLARLVSIAPPWPAEISLLTSIASVVAMLLSFQAFRGSARKVVTKVVSISICVFLATSMFYLLMLSQFVYDAPGSKTPRIKGFACTKLALDVYPEKCPWLGELELKQSEWTAEYLWETWSISVVRAALVGLWSVLVIALSMAFGSFIVYQRRQKRS